MARQLLSYTGIVAHYDLLVQLVEACNTKCSENETHYELVKRAIRAHNDQVGVITRAIKKMLVEYIMHFSLKKRMVEIRAQGRITT